MDYDEDGFYPDEGDCDDTDPTTYPGAALEDSDTACMTDADGDGYGDANPENENVEPGTDCDDTDPDVNPVMKTANNQGDTNESMAIVINITLNPHVHIA